MDPLHRFGQPTLSSRRERSPEWATWPESADPMTIDPTTTVHWNLHQAWLEPDASLLWQRTLQNRIAWQQPVVRVYGKKHPVPRMTGFLAVEGLNYRYSGAVHSGAGWPQWFTPLLLQVNEACEADFNGCLLNLYRNGDDRMGWHADDEPEIDQNAPIASLSLGATRDFQLRNRIDPHQRSSLALADGDLLVMHQGCQQHWMHSIPQRRRIKTLRINLTFRRFRNN